MKNKNAFSDKRNLLLCLLIAFAGLGGYFYLSDVESHKVTEKPAGKVLESTGIVQFRREKFQNWKNISQNSPLFDNSTVYTQPASEALLKLYEVEVRIGEKTLIQIIEPEKRNEVWMDFGSFVVGSQKKKSLTLKVGGKVMRLSLEKAQVQVLRNEEGLTEVRSLRGEVELEVDGKIQKISEQSPQSFNLPGGNSQFFSELANTTPTFTAASKKLLHLPDLPPSGERKTVIPRAMANVEETPPPSPPPPTPPKPITAEPDKVKYHRKWKRMSFQLGLGGNYIRANEKSPFSESELQGFSGPTIYGQGWIELTNSLGLEFSYLSVHSNARASLYGENAQASFDWSSMSVGLFSKKDSGFPLIRGGLYRQELPLFFETDSQIHVDRAEIHSLYLGYGQITDLRSDLFFMWDAKALLPINSTTSGIIDRFKPGLGLEATVGVYKCLSENWSLGLNSMVQYQPTNYSAPYGNSGISVGYSSELLNISNQVRIIYGTCGNY